MKLPVAYNIDCREASLEKDALLRNGVAEVDEAQKLIRARKRPAIDSAYTATSGVGQALFTWTTPGTNGNPPNETLVSITDDTINTSPTPVNKYLSFTVQPS